MSSYSKSGSPAFNSAGASAAIRNEFAAIETAVNSKSDKANPTFTGTVTLPSTTSIGNVSAAEIAVLDGVPATLTGTELGHVDGVTSPIQTQLNDKASVGGTSIRYIETASLNIAGAGDGVNVPGYAPYSAAAAPASPTSSGTKGELRFDDKYMYRCIATDTWRYIPLILPNAIYAENYATLADADAAAVAAGKQLVISTLQTLTTYTFNSDVKVVTGGKINNSGAVHFAGAFEGCNGCFIGAGDIDFSSSKLAIVPVEWFLARTDSLQQAMTSASGKTVTISTVLTSSQSNILTDWPSDRALKVEKGGSINPTTKFTGLNEVTPEMFGTGNGALALAIAAGQTIRLSNATYTTNVPLTLIGKKLIGNMSQSIIACTSAVTTACLTVGTQSLVDGVTIEGAATTNTTGILIDGTTNSTLATVRNFRVQHFTGATGYGIRLQKAQTDLFENGYVSSNGTGLYIPGDGPYPTTNTFRSVTFDSSTDYGAHIKASLNTVFEGNCIFQSSGKEGLLIDTTSGFTLSGTVIRDAWFEDNYKTGNATNYHMRVYGPAGQANVSVQDSYFSPTAVNGVTTANRKSILADGANAAKISLSNLDHSFIAGAVTFSNGAYGNYLNFKGSVGDYNTSVSDANKYVRNDTVIGHAWVDYTPTFASSIGDAATTFANATSGMIARYQVIGKMCYVNLRWTRTLNVVTPAWISLTTPPGIAFTYPTTTVARISQNDVYESGALGVDPSGIFYFGRAVGLFTSAAVLSGSATIVFEVD